MPQFSWQKVIDRALETKLRRARTQAKAQHPDFKKSHPSEARAAATGQFTELNKRVKDEFLTSIKNSNDRIQKRNTIIPLNSDGGLINE